MGRRANKGAEWNLTFSVMGCMPLTTNIVQVSFCVLVFKNYKSYRSYKSYKSYTKFLFVIRVGLRPPCEAHALRGDRFPSPDHKEEFTPHFLFTQKSERELK